MNKWFEFKLPGWRSTVDHMIMLAVTASECWLPSYIIFEQQTLPKQACHKGIIMRTREKGWFNEYLVHGWMRTVEQKTWHSIFIKFNSFIGQSALSYGR
jgi:hypothetical protein